MSILAIPYTDFFPCDILLNGLAPRDREYLAS